MDNRIGQRIVLALGMTLVAWSTPAQAQLFRALPRERLPLESIQQGWMYIKPIAKDPTRLPPMTVDAMPHMSFNFQTTLKSDEMLKQEAKPKSPMYHPPLDGYRPRTVDEVTHPLFSPRASRGSMALKPASRRRPLGW